MRYLYGIMLFCMLLAGCIEVEKKEETKQAATQQENQNSSKENNLSKKEKQKEIIEFINDDVQRVAAYEKEALKVMESVQGENYIDDQTTYDAIVNEIIPLYEKAIAEAKNLEPSFDDLETPTKKMVETTETFHNGLLLQQEAFEKMDVGIQEQATEKFEEYFELVEEYHTIMEDICETYNVVYDRKKTVIEN